MISQYNTANSASLVMSPVIYSILRYLCPLRSVGMETVARRCDWALATRSSSGDAIELRDAIELGSVDVDLFRLVLGYN